MSQFWAGFQGSKIDVREIDDGWCGFGAPEARCRMPALFTSWERARREYQDVRKVEVRVVSRKRK